MNPMKRVGRMRSVRKVHTGHTATARLQKRDMNTRMEENYSTT